jgi:hypothetical protein
MKAKTRQKVGKWFAIFVVILMMFQVLLPLFTSTYLNSSTPASVTAATDQTATANNETAANPVTPANTTTTIPVPVPAN